VSAAAAAAAASASALAIESALAAAAIESAFAFSASALFPPQEAKRATPTVRMAKVTFFMMLFVFILIDSAGQN
jgi:hypothetical protein